MSKCNCIHEPFCSMLNGQDIVLPTPCQYRTGWIPVAERLPELQTYIYSVDVLFCDADGDIYIGYLNFETERWKCNGSSRQYTATHWMPLPLLPKEVSNE